MASNNFASPQQQSFEFDITEQGDYVIAIYSASSGWSDCIVGQLILTADSYLSTAIKEIHESPSDSSAIYDLQGRKVSVFPTSSVIPKGIYIKNGKKFVIK